MTVIITMIKIQNLSWKSSQNHQNFVVKLVCRRNLLYLSITENILIHLYLQNMDGAVPENCDLPLMETDKFWLLFWIGLKDQMLQVQGTVQDMIYQMKHFVWKQFHHLISSSLEWNSLTLYLYLILAQQFFLHQHLEESHQEEPNHKYLVHCKKKSIQTFINYGEFQEYHSVYR